MNVMLTARVLETMAFCLPTHAQSSGNVTQENGYEITRSEALVRPPHGKIGRKTISRETRIGKTEDTDGNSFTAVMTLGGFVNKCPVPDESTVGKFVVPGVSFEYSLTADQVNTDEGATQRTHYAKRVEVTLIRAHLNDDATVKEVEVDAVYTSDLDGVRTGPIRDRRTVRLGEGGMPDLDKLKHAVIATGDLAIAALLWNAAQTNYTAQSDESAWLKAINACVEFAFDPPSDERALGPNQSEEVHVTLQTKEGKYPVAHARFQGGSLNAIGQLAPRQGNLNDDGQVTLAYTASANPKAGHGFDVAIRSRAGLANAQWRISGGPVRLMIEHRIWGDRGTPGALVGNALFDGTVKFDVTLVPLPHRPGTLLAKVAVVRQVQVGHVTPSRCQGSGSRREDWNFVATVDAATKALRLDAEMYHLDGVGEWTCSPGVRDELIVQMVSELQPLVVPATIGIPQNFVVLRPDGNHETINVTVVASPAAR